MRSFPRVVGALFVAAAFLAPTPLVAQDGKAPAAPAAADDDVSVPFQSEIDGIRKLAAAGNWKGGKDAVDAFFKAHQGDLRVGARLPEIEEDLRRCLYQLAGGAGKPHELLGRGATKYSEGSRKAEFSYVGVGRDKGWIESSGVWVLDVLFDGEVTVELPVRLARTAAVFVGFDSEKQGGYAFFPFATVYTDYSGVEVRRSVAIKAIRLDPGAADRKELSLEFPLDSVSSPTVRFVLTGSGLSCQAGKTKSRTVYDGKYRKGFVAIRPVDDAGRGAAAIAVSPIWIGGKLEATFAKRQIAEAESRRFREWTRKSYDRKVAVPAWVIEAEKDAVAWQSRVPFDCPDEWRQFLRDAMRDFFEDGDVPEWLEPPVPGKPREVQWDRLPAATRAWLASIAAFAESRYADAEEQARRLMEVDPGFGPAWTMLGASLLARGQLDEAVAALEEARGRDAHFAPTYDTLVLAAFRDGDWTRARTALAEAAQAGTATAATGPLRRLLLRVERGPAWKKRFETKTAHFTIASDASVEVCQQVGRVLEEALGIYHQKFRPLQRKGSARVYVFSGMESYLEYAAEKGQDLSSTLGVYVPRLRELCVFLHENRPMLWETVRHEAFHQYLHNFIEEAPAWFNEGYAEFFGFSRRVAGSAKVGQVDEDQAAAAKELLDQFTPLRKLFTMDHDTFMEGADVHYVQSWAVVHTLRAPDDPKLKGVLDRYTDLLLAGKSRKEAYDEALAPVVDVIEAAVKRHVAKM